MRNKQILIILSSFDESEWRSCHKYIKYCNKKESKILDLFEYIFRYRKNPDSPKLAIDKVKAKIAPEANDKAFLNIMADLVRDVENFLVHEEITKKNKAYERNKILSDLYKSRGLYDRYRSKMRVVRKEIEKLPKLDLFQDLRHLEYYHSLYFSEVNEKYTDEDDSLSKAHTALISFSNQLLIFYNTEEANRKKLYKIVNQPDASTSDNDLQKLLDHLNNLVKNSDHKSYQSLKSALTHHVNDMSDELSEAILLYLINFITSEFKKGNASIEDIASLYDLGLKERILLHGGKLSDNRFLSIIEIVSKSETHHTPDVFINQWLPEVESQEKQSVENLAYAHWYFSKKEYDKTIKKLDSSETRIVNINLSMRARWLKICALYSLYPSHENSDEIIASAKVFLKRHESEIGNLTYQGTLNLFEIVKLMWNNTDYSTLSNFVDNCDYLIFRTWVNETIEEMKKEY